MELLTIGKIGGTHHLKGAVKIHSSLGEVLEKIAGEKIFLELPNGETKILTVKNIAPLVSDRWIIEFDEIKNKTEAGGLVKAVVKVRRDIIGIADDEYLLNDLLEMQVFDESEKFIGTIVNIFDTAAHEILEIESETEEGMIPNISEFVKNVDFEKREMIVSLLEGMIEAKKVKPVKVIKEKLKSEE